MILQMKYVGRKCLMIKDAMSLYDLKANICKERVAKGDPGQTIHLDDPKTTLSHAPT